VATTIAVPREVAPGERRVALVPDSVRRLHPRGFEVAIEAGAGEGAWFPDDAYRAAGATVVPDREGLMRADIVVGIHPPSPETIARLREGTAVIGLLAPAFNHDLVRLMAARILTAVAIDNLPRTTLAQGMDVLSSQSTVAGYRAVILAAQALPRFFPMLMTAAGTISPARVFIIGAGVAGLQAIGVARRLGAVVEAFDVRQAVREEVQSLGAKFVDAGLEEDAQAAGGYAREVGAESRRRAGQVIAERLAQADVCITTALIPGRPAPQLITGEMVRAMRPGSVIVDLAAERGGNCALTEPGADVVRHGVTIIGRLNLPSEVPVHASQMYSRNVERLVLHLVRDGTLVVDPADEISRSCVVTHAGQPVAGRT
jgi:NAD(P) transhydrogenase subunit alpha